VTKRVRTFFFVAAGLMVAFAACGVAYTAAQGGSSAKPLAITLWEQSNSGTEVGLGPNAATLLDQFTGTRVGKLGPVYVLHNENGRALYRIASATSYVCYGAGPASSVVASADLGMVACPTDPTFPSAALPVLDFSLRTTVYGSAPRFTRVEGIASDGVVAVGLLDSSGNTLRRIPVESNTYEYVPTPNEAVSALVAYDASGNSMAIHSH